VRLRPAVAAYLAGAVLMALMLLGLVLPRALGGGVYEARER
jgi:hypothetical protein